MIEPLDLQTILVNTFAGSVEIFIFIAFIFIAGMSAYFRMPNMITMIMFALFAVLLSSYLGGIYVLVILIAGLITFWGVSKIVKG